MAPASMPELLARSIDLAVPMIAGGRRRPRRSHHRLGRRGVQSIFLTRQFERDTRSFLASLRHGQVHPDAAHLNREHKLRLKAEGRDDTAIVVIDPHADLIEAILPLVPEEVIGMTMAHRPGKRRAPSGDQPPGRAHFRTSRKSGRRTPRNVSGAVGVLGAADGAIYATRSHYSARRQRSPGT